MALGTKLKHHQSKHSRIILAGLLYLLKVSLLASLLDQASVGSTVLIRSVHKERTEKNLKEENETGRISTLLCVQSPAQSS